MSMTSFFEGLKQFIRTNFITRFTGIMLKGSLGQKVFVILGCLLILFGVYKAFYWILLSTGGYLIVYLAFKDYDKETKLSKDL